MNGSSRTKKKFRNGMLNLAALAIAMSFVMSTEASLSVHLPLADSSFCPVTSYRIIDLGVADLQPKELTKFEQVISLAPHVNNLGIVVFNTAEGAIVRDAAIGEYRLNVNGAKVYCHALDNPGFMLVSVNRPDKTIEWMVWPRRTRYGLMRSECEINTDKKHVANLNSKDSVVMSLLNDWVVAAGYRHSVDKLETLIWTPLCGLMALSGPHGPQLYGFPRGINNRCSIAGFFQDANDSPPFLRKMNGELDVLRNYRSLVNCQGWIELADLVVTEDDVVYGTYVVKYISDKLGNPDDLNVYFTYRWQPSVNDFNILDIRNMRIGAVNNANTLAGSYKGQAAIRRQGAAPVQLNTLISDEAKEWELLEATGINDRDQIVGYGIKQGKIHLFLIEPVSSEHELAGEFI